LGGTWYSIRVETMTDSNPRPEEEIADQWSLEDMKKSILDNAAEYDRIVRHQNEEEKDVEEGKGSEGQSTS